MLITIILLLALLPATTAHAEPISTAIELTSLIASATGASAAVAGTIGGIIVGTAISAGLSFVSSLLQPRPSGQGAASSDFGGATTDTNTQSVRYTERQALPSKRVIVGRAYVGFALFFEQVQPPYLTMGGLLNHGKIDGIDTIWIGTNQLSFASLGFNTILTPLSIDGQPDYAGHLKVSLRQGVASQPIDPLIAQDYTNIDPSFRQQGIATAVFRYHYGGADNTAATQAAFIALWGQVTRPNAYLLVRGGAAYDPRDPTQSLTDPTSWKFTNTASLIQAWYLTQDFGGRIDPSRIDWDKVAEAADWDDGQFVCKDGTSLARHTIDGVITLNQQPSDIITSMLTANRGRVLESAGRFWVSSSKPQTPIGTIHDAILAGGIEIRCAKPKRDLINKLQVRFVASEQDYQTVDGPILSRADLQATDLETLTGTLELPFTLDNRRAQRLQKAFLETSRLGRTVTCTVDISLLADLDNEPIGNAFTVASDLFPAGNGIYLCDSWGFADNFSTVDLVLSEYDPSIETDWNAANDEQDFTLADINTD